MELGFRKEASGGVPSMILYYTLLLTLPMSTAPLFADRVFGITIEKYLGLLCLLYAMIHLARRKTPASKGRGSQTYAFLFFLTLAGASWVMLGRDSFQASMMFVYVSQLAFLVSTLILVDSEERLRWSMLSVLAGVAWGSLYTLREWQKNVPIYGLRYRPQWNPAGDPNYFTASAILCLPIAFYLIVRSSHRFDRRFSAACVVLIAAAILVDSSRGGLLALVAVGGVILFQYRGRRVLILLLGCALAVGLLLSPVSPLERLLHPQSSGVIAEDDRLELWSAGLRMVARHPLMGIGLDNFKAVLPAYLEPGQNIDFIAHNTYVQMAAEMGLPGLLAFIWILAVTFRSLARSRRRASEADSTLIHCVTSGLFAGLAGFGVAIFFLSAQFLKSFWFVVFVSAAIEKLLPTATGAERGFPRASRTDLMRGTSLRGKTGKTKVKEREPITANRIPLASLRKLRYHRREKP